MPLSLTTKSTCPKLCPNFVPSFNSENLLKKEVGQFISGPKDKRYKRGIRVGYPLKTERNYAPIRTVPPISAQLTPNPGPGRAALPRRSSVYGKSTIKYSRCFTQQKKKAKAQALDFIFQTNSLKNTAEKSVIAETMMAERFFILQSKNLSCCAQ